MPCTMSLTSHLMIMARWAFGRIQLPAFRRRPRRSRTTCRPAVAAADDLVHLIDGEQPLADDVAALLVLRRSPSRRRLSGRVVSPIEPRFIRRPRRTVVDRQS
jgi:hypothetical protein